jgi:glycosyltransferase involved in cell wall biosynthesis
LPRGPVRLARGARGTVTCGRLPFVEPMLDVLLLCEYPSLNGGENSMLATRPRLGQEGLRFAVACPAAGPLADALRGRGVEVVAFQPRDASGRRRPLGELREQLAGLLRRRSPRLLHANSLAMARLSGPVACRLGLPSIGHLRDIIRLSARAIGDVACHARLVAVSRATRAWYLRQGLAAEKTFVLHNGVDLERFHPRPPTGYLHRELGLPPGARLAGTIGQIGLRKGQDVLRQAAATLADQAPELHYLIVGRRFSEKDESRRFEQEVRSAAWIGPLAGRWHSLGWRRDVPELLSELTLLVHPARQEPLGRVLLEAAACGVPVVATDVGGTREIFGGCPAVRDRREKQAQQSEPGPSRKSPPPPDGEAAALLVAPDDAGALAAAIATLLRDEPRRVDLAAGAPPPAEAHFDVRHAAEGLLAHYRALRPP